MLAIPMFILKNRPLPSTGKYTLMCPVLSRSGCVEASSLYSPAHEWDTSVSIAFQINLGLRKP